MIRNPVSKEYASKTVARKCPCCDMSFSYIQALRDDKVTKGRIIHFVQCCYCGNNVHLEGNSWVRGTASEPVGGVPVVETKPEPEPETVIVEDEAKRGRGRPKGKK